MASKQLTAKVRLNTTSAEASINRLVQKMNTLNNALDRAGNNKVERQLNNSQNRLTGIVNRVKQWYHNQTSVNSQLKTGNSILRSMGSRLRGIAATYLGLMTMRTALNASDTITSSQNRLNYVTAQQLGDDGYTADGSQYSETTLNATQDAMDKMYASAQRSRMDYGDMMSNVSKSMALAGDAFGYSIDNAIRFQETMAKAYAIGGASAQEMSSSMYQLIQALSAGTLAGDELRSVREGAPLAYKAIEEFVQGVYNTDKSLKELGAEGKVTSDMVIAAIMGMNDSIDKSFAMTEQTFAQTWTQIKNSALKAFEPISNKLRTMLNDAIDSGALTNIENIFVGMADAISIALDKISLGITWIADNWYWLEDVLVAGISTVATLMISSAIISAAAWIIANWQLILVALAIFVIIYALILWKQGVLTTTQFILVCIQVIAVAFIILGLMFHMTWLWMLGVALLVIMWVLESTTNLCDAIAKLAFIVAVAIIAYLLIIGVVALITGTVILSTVALIALAIIAVIAILAVIFFTFTEEVVGAVYVAGAFIYNLVVGVIDSIIQLLWTSLVEPWIGIIEFILNCCNGGFNTFGDMVANLIGQVISWFFSLGQVVTKIIDAIFGTNWTSGLEALKGKVIAWGKNEQAITLSREAPTVSSISGSFGVDLPDRFAYGDAYKNGANDGAGIKESVNSFGEPLFDNFGGAGALTDILGNLGNISDIGSVGVNNGLPDINDPLLDAGNAYNQPDFSDLSGIGKDVGGIGKDTGSIADSMDLAEEDLAYLRQLADREWKKEYTTANIVVDMSNYNTINGDGDLDGIVTKLRDKLYEEMSSLADGVYA